jgi:hypothetical protein
VIPDRCASHEPAAPVIGAEGFGQAVRPHLDPAIDDHFQFEQIARCGTRYFGQFHRIAIARVPMHEHIDTGWRPAAVTPAVATAAAIYRAPGRARRQFGAAKHGSSVLLAGPQGLYDRTNSGGHSDEQAKSEE